MKPFIRQMLLSSSYYTIIMILKMGVINAWLGTSLKEGEEELSSSILIIGLPLISNSVNLELNLADNYHY